MKLKLDENLGRSVLTQFEQAGHDVSSVYLQGMAGASDTTVLQVCIAEQRALITFDVDFANPIQHDPRTTAGVAVLRLPKNPGPSDIAAAVSTLINGLATHSIVGSLWIVRNSKIRVWQPTD